MAKPPGGLDCVISDHHQAHHLLRREDAAPAGRLLVIPLMGCEQQHPNMAAFKCVAGAIWALLLFAVQRLHCVLQHPLLPPPQMYVRRTQSTSVRVLWGFLYGDICLHQQ